MNVTFVYICLTVVDDYTQCRYRPVYADWYVSNCFSLYPIIMKLKCVPLTIQSLSLISFPCDFSSRSSRSSRISIYLSLLCCLLLHLHFSKKYLYSFFRKSSSTSTFAKDSSAWAAHGHGFQRLLQLPGQHRSLRRLRRGLRRRRSRRRRGGGFAAAQVVEGLVEEVSGRLVETGGSMIPWHGMTTTHDCHIVG